MNPSEIQDLIYSIRDQTNKLKKTVQEKNKYTRTDPERALSSKFSIPYDPSLEEIRDTLENDESFADASEHMGRRYPPLELVPSTFKNRTEPQAASSFSQERYVVMSDLTPSSEQHHHHHNFDEYSFHTPVSYQNREEIFGIKTAEFEGLGNNESDYIRDFKKKNNSQSQRKVQKSPNRISHRNSMKENDEVKSMKEMIAGLLHDNGVLSQDVEDFKKAMQIMVSKHKELQRQLENEKKKAENAKLLEQQLKEERAKNKALSQANYLLKEKGMKIVEFLQHLSAEEQKFTQEEERINTQIITENQQLRHLLGISQISDPKFEDLDKETKEKVNEFEEAKEQFPEGSRGIPNGDDLRITPSVLEEFRRDRQNMFSRQRTVSMISDRISQIDIVSQAANSNVSTDILYDSNQPSLQSLEQSVQTNESMTSDK